MCKVDWKVKKWFEVVNNMGQDVAYHARDEYDTFLEKCLEPYGIDKINATLYADRVYIEEESPHIKGCETVSYQRFYIDGKYVFTVVFKQEPVNYGDFTTGMITTYEKIVEQDRVPKEKSMTNKEAIDILRGHQLFEVSPVTNEAFNKAIEALEEQDKYQWIFGCVGDPELDNLFEEVEKALGFRLFYWQKTYVYINKSRRSGATTAIILNDLLRDTEATPLDYTKPASDKRSKFYRDELLKIKEKLDKAGIKTREVWRCSAEKDKWYEKRSEHISQTLGATVPPNGSRNYSGLFDKED